LVIRRIPWLVCVCIFFNQFIHFFNRVGIISFTLTCLRMLNILIRPLCLSVITAKIISLNEIRVLAINLWAIFRCLTFAYGPIIDNYFVFWDHHSRLGFWIWDLCKLIFSKIVFLLNLSDSFCVRIWSEITTIGDSRIELGGYYFVLKH
jgi:hypothetical protein